MSKTSRARKRALRADLEAHAGKGDVLAAMRLQHWQADQAVKRARHDRIRRAARWLSAIELGRVPVVPEFESEGSAVLFTLPSLREVRSR